MKAYQHRCPSYNRIPYSPSIPALYLSIPDLCAEGESGFDEWSALIHTLTEFCGCSLEYSISRQQVEAGDGEQIARVGEMLSSW